MVQSPGNYLNCGCMWHREYAASWLLWYLEWVWHCLSNSVHNTSSPWPPPPPPPHPIWTLHGWVVCAVLFSVWLALVQTSAPTATPFLLYLEFLLGDLQNEVTYQRNSTAYFKAHPNPNGPKPLAKLYNSPELNVTQTAQLPLPPMHLVLF